MPYIKKSDRERLVTDVEQTAGEFNYSVTRLVNTYIETKGLSYQTLNDILGALEGAKLELYRRVAAPYETQKAHDNGDIYKC